MPWNSPSSQPTSWACAMRSSDSLGVSLENDNLTSPSSLRRSGDRISSSSWIDRSWISLSQRRGAERGVDAKELEDDSAATGGERSAESTRRSWKTTAQRPEGSGARSRPKRDRRSGCCDLAAGGRAVEAREIREPRIVREHL